MPMRPDAPPAAEQTTGQTAPAVKTKTKSKDKAKDKVKGKGKAAATKADKNATAKAPDKTQDKSSDKTQPAAPAKPEPKGPFILIDARTGEVLMEGRSGEPYYPGLAHQADDGLSHLPETAAAGQMKPDQQLVVSELAHAQEPSKIGVPTGKTVSVDFALQALLVYSANDMAYVLAEGASGSIRRLCR